MSCKHKNRNEAFCLDCGARLYTPAAMTDKTPTQEPMWEYDSKAANKEFDTYEKGLLCVDSFHRGARWQFEKDKAQLEKMAKLVEELEANSDMCISLNLHEIRMSDLESQLAKLQQQNEKAAREIENIRHQIVSVIDDMPMTQKQSASFRVIKSRLWEAMKALEAAE